jgi:hypothetical protein
LALCNASVTAKTQIDPENLNIPYSVPFDSADKAIPAVLAVTENGFIVHADLTREKSSPLFEIALVLVRFDQDAGRIVNANHSIM